MKGITLDEYQSWCEHPMTVKFRQELSERQADFLNEKEELNPLLMGSESYHVKSLAAHVKGEIFYFFTELLDGSEDSFNELIEDEVGE